MVLDAPTGSAEEDALGKEAGLENGPEFRRGWDAAITAARHWHEGQASQALVLSRRTRFPKSLERDAEVHRRAAELMATLSPEQST